MGVLLLGGKNRIMNIFLLGVWLQRASGGGAEKVRERVGACWAARLKEHQVRKEGAMSTWLESGPGSSVWSVSRGEELCSWELDPLSANGPRQYHLADVGSKHSSQLATDMKQRDGFWKTAPCESVVSQTENERLTSQGGFCLCGRDEQKGLERLWEYGTWWLGVRVRSAIFEPTLRARSCGVASQTNSNNGGKVGPCIWLNGDSSKHLSPSRSLETCEYDLVWKKGLRRCNSVTGLKMRSFWMILSPSSSDRCLIRDRGDTGHVIREAKTRVTESPGHP